MQTSYILRGFKCAQTATQLLTSLYLKPQTSNKWGFISWVNIELLLDCALLLLYVAVLVAHWSFIKSALVSLSFTCFILFFLFLFSFHFFKTELCLSPSLKTVHVSKTNILWKAVFFPKRCLYILHVLHHTLFLTYFLFYICNVFQLPSGCVCLNISNGRKYSPVFITQLWKICMPALFF